MTALRGKLYFNVPLANYTSWRVGGPAQRLYQPADKEDLQVFLSTLPSDQALFWIGLGSNLLVRDGGYAGTVIVTQGKLSQITQLDEVTVRFEAGVACGTAARFCARLGLMGIEFLAGVPGTIGGALAMNAGANGGETWQFVHACETIDRDGKSHLRTPDEYQVGYRSVTPPSEEWFTAGHFRLVLGDKAESLMRIKTLLAHRSATQPINLPSCGSVFRNPPQGYAAKLIEKCGLKGRRIGGASVSTKHANFIVNDGTATAKDIECLIAVLQDEVARHCQVALVPEIHILGEA